jgi:RNA polymerase sigma-32 factor
MQKMALTALPTPLSNLHRYITLVERFPRLDEDKEQELARRFQRDNDLDAAWELVTSHLRYVVQIARGYSGYGLPQEDLIQEGNIGLMTAVKRFNQKRGVRLVAYAAYWIRAQIHDFILKNWRIVKVATTKAKRKLFYKLRRAKRRCEWLSRDEANDIAQTLDVSPEDVIDMEASLYASDESFDGPADATTEVSWSPAAYLEDYTFEPESVVSETQFFDTTSAVLQEVLCTLDARSRDIVECRWLADDDVKITLQELANRYQISAERVRQLEFAAIKHLREVMIPRLDGETVATSAK